MRQHLPYLIPAALAVLAVFIVLNRPGEPEKLGFSRVEIDQLRDEAGRVSPEALQRELQRWVADLQDQLPLNLPIEREVLALETHDLTVEARIRLSVQGSYGISKALADDLRDSDMDACRDETMRRLLEAGVELVMVFEDQDGKLIRNHLLRKASCRS